MGTQGRCGAEQNIPFAREADCAGRINPRAEQRQRSFITGLECPDALVFDEEPVPRQVRTHRRKEGVVARDRDAVPKVSGGRACLDEGSIDRSVPVKVTPHERAAPLRREHGESDRPSFCLDDAIGPYTGDQGFRGNRQPTKSQSLFRVDIGFNRMRCPQGLLPSLDMLTILECQRERERRAHHRAICGKKAEPVGFLVGIDGVEECRVAPIPYRSMRRHGFDISIWTAVPSSAPLGGDRYGH